MANTGLAGDPISATRMAAEEAEAALMNSGTAPYPAAAPAASDADTGSSALFGYNGNGSTDGMTGIGASTDTGSNSFISGAGGASDPGYDKGPVVGDGSEAFPNEAHGLFGAPKPSHIHQKHVVPFN